MTPKKKYLERRAKQAKLRAKKDGIKSSRAKKQGIQFASNIDESEKAFIISELRAQGYSEYDIQLYLEAPCKFLVTKRRTQ